MTSGKSPIRRRFGAFGVNLLISVMKWLGPYRFPLGQAPFFTKVSFMRYSSLYLVALAAVSSAATYTYTTDFYDGVTIGGPGVFTFDWTNKVGTGTLSFDSGSQLADGSYAWSSLTNLTVSLSFSGVPVTFTQADLLTNAANIAIQLRGSNFIVTGANGLGTSQTTTYTYDGLEVVSNGSANFGHLDYYISLQPVDFGFSGDPAYFLSGLFTPNANHQYDTFTNNVYMGGYGVGGTGGGAIPEPSTYGIAVAGAALVIAALRRRKA